MIEVTKIDKNGFQKMRRMHHDHAVSMLGYHIVWCTKFRHCVLQDGVDVVVRHTIGQACDTYGWKCIAIEVMPDHVHCFIQTDHTVSPVAIATALKSLTAVAVFTSYPKLKGQKFWGSGLWSRGTYYGSVGNVSADTVAKYIAEQKSRQVVKDATTRVAVSR